MKTKPDDPARSGPCTDEGVRWQGGKAGRQRGIQRG